MRLIEDIKLDFSDVLICPKRSTLASRSEVSLVREYKFRNGMKWRGFGIIAANMDTVGTFSMANAMSDHNMLTALHKHYTLEELTNFYIKSNPNVSYATCFYTMGTSDKDFEKWQALCKIFNDKVGPKYICIDIANGYSQHLVDYVKKIRGMRPDVGLMVGNVVTPEMTEELIMSGADIVKVGIGPGSVCTTRKLTGVGYPQLSAIIECADAAHGLGGFICADGGCTSPGDIAKAFGAGADFVMLGGMLAGHDESGGQVSELNGKKTMKFYGMSSDTAMDIHNGGKAAYRASEGKTVEIPYRGSVHATLQEIEGGVRSACTYTGSKTIKELPKRTTFVRVSRQLNNVFGS